MRHNDPLPNLGGSLCDSLRGKLWGGRQDSLDSSLWDSFGGPLRISLRDSLWGSLGNSFLREDVDETL